MLYTEEEICCGCEYAVFHECCDKFCRCTEGHIEEIDCLDGKCEFKGEQE